MKIFDRLLIFIVTVGRFVDEEVTILEEISQFNGRSCVTGYAYFSASPRRSCHLAGPYQFAFINNVLTVLQFAIELTLWDMEPLSLTNVKKSRVYQIR